MREDLRKNKKAKWVSVFSLTLYHACGSPQAASRDSGGQGNWPDTSASHPRTLPLSITRSPLDAALSYTLELP